MTSTLKKLPKSQIELTITVPYADYIKAEKKAVEQIGKEIKVDGFRPGHIPEEVIREKAGASAIQSFTLDTVIPVSYSAAVKEHDAQVISQPKVDIKKNVEKEGDDFVYVAAVSVMPEVKIGNYKKIKVKKKEANVTDKELKETLNMIIDRFAEWKDAERKAKNGDRVELDFEGFDQKGVAIPNTASKNHPVILGSKSMIPGFEDAVVGMKVGEEKEFDITFPKEYHSAAMQGKKVKFKLKLGRLEEKISKELDETMIERATGKKQSIDDFKKQVKSDLEREMQQRIQTETDNKVVQEIVKLTAVELPETLIEDEIKLLQEERRRSVAKQGLTWEQYLQHVKKTEEDFAKEHRKPAEERLTARLGVNHIITQEKIEAADADIDKKIEELTKDYPEDQRSQVLEYYKKDSEGYRMLKNNLSADKLISMFVVE